LAFFLVDFFFEDFFFEEDFFFLDEDESDFLAFFFESVLDFDELLPELFLAAFLVLFLSAFLEELVDELVEELDEVEALFEPELFFFEVDVLELDESELERLELERLVVLVAVPFFRPLPEVILLAVLSPTPFTRSIRSAVESNRPPLLRSSIMR